MFTLMLKRLLSLVLPTKSYLEMEIEKLSLKEKITMEAVQEIFERKGYKFFTNGRYNLNLLGVRRDTSVSNKFDDYLVAIYKSEDDAWKCLVWQATTDPGKHWLENPLNPAGTAILIPNQYRSTWKIGEHRGKYRALCQAKNVRVWRDNDKDDELDFLCENSQEGIFGINIHKSNPYTESQRVDKWSAGCQVFKRAQDYAVFMGLCDRACHLYGNSFTYTLLEEQDFNV